MKNYCLLLLSTIILNNLYGQGTFTSMQQGNWDFASTWGRSGDCTDDPLACGHGAGTHYPGATDNVFVDELSSNHNVFISNGFTATCNNLGIGTNGFGGFGTTHQLFVGTTTAASLTVNGNIDFQLGGAANMILNVRSTSTVNVVGNITFDAATDRIIMTAGASTLNLDGTLGSGGNFLGGSSSTINFKGTAVSQIMRVSGTQYDYANITCNNTHSGGLNLEGDIGSGELAGNLSIATGKFDNGGFAIAGNALKTIGVAAGATFELSGTTSAFPTGFGTVTLASTSTVVYEGSGAQAISDQSYGHLTLSTSGDKSLSSTLAASGNVTIGTSVTLNANSNDLNIIGNWSNSGTFTQGTSEVTMNGSSAQTIGGSTTTTFFDLVINNTHVSDKVSLDVNANLEGALTLTDGDFDVNGNTFTLLSTASGTARIATITGGAITGDITMQRFVAAGNTGWHTMGIPVASTTVLDWDQDTDFILSLDDGNEGVACCPTFYSIHEYNHATEQFDAITTVGTTLSAEEGYFVYTGTGSPSTNAFTFDVTGTPNTGTQNFSLTNTTDDFNFISNPYASPIDGNLNDAALWPTFVDISNEVHVFDPNASGGAAYQVYSGGIASPAGWDGQIAAHQGFWIVEIGNSPDLAVAETAKTSGSPDKYFKKVDTMSFFRVGLSAGAGYVDEAVIRFTQGATMGVDNNYDAHQLTNAFAPKAIISTVVEDSTDLVINSVPELTSSITIPVRVTVVNSGTYSISLREINYVAESSCLVLEDKLTNTFTDIRTDTSYTFTISDTTYAPRFLMHIGAPISKDRSNLACQGDNNGMAIAGVSGNGPWSYAWTNSNGDTVRSVSSIYSTDTLAGLTAGVYTVFVTDPGGLCTTVMDTITIMEPAAISTSTQLENITCFGNNDGSIDVTTAGGTPPYAYVWSNGDNTEDVSNLTPGAYSVNITDNNSCLTIVNVTVTEPDNLELSGLASDVNCNGENNGAVDITAIGGTSPYVYLWSNSESTEDISGLAPGTYSIQVTDNNNCLADGSFEITEPIIVVSTFVAQKDTAYLSDGGEVQFTNTSFGASGFEWDFDDGSPANTEVSPLHVFGAAGTYNVTMVASNANNCSDTSYKSTVIMDSPLVGIGNELAEDLSWKVNYITNGDGLFAEFSFEEPTSVTLHIFNVLGQEVSSLDDVEAFKNTVKIMGPQKTIATYLIRVDTDSGSTSKKVIY